MEHFRVPEEHHNNEEHQEPVIHLDEAGEGEGEGVVGGVRDDVLRMPARGPPPNSRRKVLVRVRLDVVVDHQCEDARGDADEVKCPGLAKHGRHAREHEAADLQGGRQGGRGQTSRALRSILLLTRGGGSCGEASAGAKLAPAARQTP